MKNIKIVATLIFLISLLISIVCIYTDSLSLQIFFSMISLVGLIVAAGSRLEEIITNK